MKSQEVLFLNRPFPTYPRHFIHNQTSFIMKKFIFFLGLQLVFIAAIAQNTPCPNILSHGFTTVTQVGTNCTTKVYVNASGDVGAQKGLRIQVYLGTITGPLLADTCVIVPPRSPSNYYESPTFTVPCDYPVYRK